MGRQLPAAVTNAIRAQVLLVAVSGLIAALTVVRSDALVATWNARQSSDVAAPEFAPVAIVLFGTFALLVFVLLAFFRGGHEAARVSLLGLAAFFLFTMYVLVRQQPPTEFVVMGLVSAAIDLVLVWFLLHRDTTAFLRDAEVADRGDG